MKPSIQYTTTRSRATFAAVTMRCSSSAMCMPCRTSRSAIFDLATVFSAAVTSFPATARWIRPMAHKRATPTTNPSNAIAAERSSVRRRRPSAASSSAICRRATTRADDAFNGLPCQVVHVQRRKSQHDPRSDADQGRAFQGLDGHGAGNALSDEVVEGPLGARRAFRRRSAEDVRPQEDDGAIGVGEGSRLCGRRRALQGRRERE